MVQHQMQLCPGAPGAGRGSYSSGFYESLHELPQLCSELPGIARWQLQAGWREFSISYILQTYVNKFK